MNVPICLTLLLCVQPISVPALDIPLTIDQLIPRPRRTLTQATLKLDHEHFVLLSCNISKTVAPTSTLKLGWQYRVTEGHVIVDNTTFGQANDQLAVGVSFPGKEPKGKVNLTCTATYASSQTIYYQTSLHLVNGSVTHHSSSLLLLLAAMLIVALRSCPPK